MLFPVRIEKSQNIIFHCILVDLLCYDVGQRGWIGEGEERKGGEAYLYKKQTTFPEPGVMMLIPYIQLVMEK